MRITEQSCEVFVEVLASKEPVPGGGGAAAMVGAIGTALADMVGSLTVGKKKYATVEEDVIKLKQQAKKLEERFMALVTEDAKAFKPLSQAYGLPKETEQQRIYKEIVMETALSNACDVPVQIMECCCKAIRLVAEIEHVGADIAISDIGCGIACLRAALTSASLNVFINTKSMKDRTKAEGIEKYAKDMLDEYVPICDKIFTNVSGKIR